MRIMSRRLAFTLASKSGFVRRIRRIGAGSPRTSETGRAPETIFRPEQNSDLVARRRERRCVRIMRAANEIESGVLHQFHVAKKSAVGHRVAPAGVVLMHVRALEIIMLAVEEKSLVGGELEPAETERRRVIIHRLAAVQHDGFHRIQIRIFRRPKFGIRNRRAGLVKNIGRARRDGLRGFHLRDGFSFRVQHAGFHRDRFWLRRIHSRLPFSRSPCRIPSTPAAW